MSEDKYIYKKVEFPHLGYEVIFKDMKYLKGIDIKGGGYTMPLGDHTCYVFIEDIEKTVKRPNILPFLSHELVHVLQFICEARAMKFTEEKEHMAYMMSHMLNQLLGYEYPKIPTNT